VANSLICATCDVGQRRQRVLAAQTSRELPGFVKEFLAKELFGDKYNGFVDCLDSSPREDQLDEIVQTLRPILEALPEGPIADESVCQEIQRVLDGIRGVNYDDYVRPHLAIFGQDARMKLPGLLDLTEEDGMTVMERRTWQGLLLYDREWVEETIDVPNGLEVIPEFPGALRLLRTLKDQRRLVIMASHFIIFAENERPEARRRAAMAFLAFLALLEASGNVDSSVVIRHRKSLQSFLMGVKGLGTEEDEPVDKEKAKRSFWKACRLCLPKGYCAGAAAGVVSTSGFLAISGNSFLCIAEKLGLANTRKMLLAHNLYKENLTFPLDPSSTCNGAPAAGHYPAINCATPVELQRFMIIGTQTPDHAHAFEGYGCCFNCRYNMSQRELARLKETNKREGLRPVQAKRLKRKVEARNVRRQLHAVAEKARYQTKPARPLQWMDYKSAKEHPPFFIELLKRAVGLFVYESGNTAVSLACDRPTLSGPSQEGKCQAPSV
jgi:hypothetical protein